MSQVKTQQKTIIGRLKCVSSNKRLHRDKKCPHNGHLSRALDALGGVL